MIKSFLFLLLTGAFSVMASAQTGERESNLKAAFIYNFTMYIDWDAETTESDFVIGVLKPSDIIRPLTEIARSGTVNNKRIVIKQFSKPEEISYCNILFIPGKLTWSLRSILDRVGRGTLTISEQEGYARQGTAFNFVIINDKLKFEANLKAISATGLKAGSQLLKLAIIVD